MSKTVDMSAGIFYFYQYILHYFGKILMDVCKDLDMNYKLMHRCPWVPTTIQRL